MRKSFNPSLGQAETERHSNSQKIIRYLFREIYNAFVIHFLKIILKTDTQTTL